MCGIVGYIGMRPSVGVLLGGLARLEYRGYDSAGVAILEGDEVTLRRAEGKLSNLADLLNANPPQGTVGISHTRWATHGEPSERNAHPHRDATERVYVTHNGIIENYAELKAELEVQGVTFRSQTDTEVLPNLIARCYDTLTQFEGAERLREAVRQTLLQVRGAYGIAVLHRDLPNVLVAAREMSPLVVGLGEGENVIASDVPALLDVTRRVIYLENGQMAVLTRESVDVYAIKSGIKQDVEPETVEWSLETAEKGGFDSFMLKEIHEQPEVMTRLLVRYTDAERKRVLLDEIGLSDDELRQVRRIFVIACGTSWHAGLIGRMLIERLPNVAVEVDTASEFRYRNPILSPETLVVCISQSGETADTLAALSEAKGRGLKCIAIVNNRRSNMAREAHGIIYTDAGLEVSVASTKAFTAQIAALYLFSLHLGQLHGLVNEQRMQRRLSKLTQVAELMTRMLAPDSSVQKATKQVAESIWMAQNALFIGRGFGYPNALEGALKLKEISYIHAEGLAAGELKHGPIALVDVITPTIAIATSGSVYEKMVSNVQEVKARGGRVVAIAAEGNEEVRAHATWVIPVPELTESFAPFITSIPLQLLAYHIATLRGCNVDMPRNLAKSVTVE